MLSAKKEVLLRPWQSDHAIQQTMSVISKYWPITSPADRAFLIRIILELEVHDVTAYA